VIRTHTNANRRVTGAYKPAIQNTNVGALNTLYFCERLNEKRLGLVDGGAGALSYDFARVLVEGAGLGDGVDGFLDLGIGFE